MRLNSTGPPNLTYIPLNSLPSASNSIDRHGVGGLSMLFDADGSEFKGMYVRFGGPVEFSRMERRYWNEWTSWNGKLQ